MPSIAKDVTAKLNGKKFFFSDSEKFSWTEKVLIFQLTIWPEHHNFI